MFYVLYFGHVLHKKTILIYNFEDKQENCVAESVIIAGFCFLQIETTAVREINCFRNLHQQTLFCAFCSAQ